MTRLSQPGYRSILERGIGVEEVLLYPASERMYPGRDQYYAGEGFPLRFRIEASDDPEFAHSRLIADLTAADFPDVGDNITKFSTTKTRARYVRLSATKLRPVRIIPAGDTPFERPEWRRIVRTSL